MLDKILVCGILIILGTGALYAAFKKGGGAFFILLFSAACYRYAYRYYKGQLK